MVQTHVVIACRELTAGTHSQRDVSIARIVSGHCLITDSCIRVARALRKRRRANPDVVEPCRSKISSTKATEEV